MGSFYHLKDCLGLDMYLLLMSNCGGLLICSRDVTLILLGRDFAPCWKGSMFGRFGFSPKLKKTNLTCPSYRMCIGLNCRCLELLMCSSPLLLSSWPFIHVFCRHYTKWLIYPVVALCS